MGWTGLGRCAAIIMAIGLYACPAAATGALEPLRVGTPHEALYCLDVEGASAVAVGAPTLLFESADGGRTWSRPSVPETDQALLGCALRHGIGLIVGQGGVILRRGAGETAWQAVDGGQTGRLFAVDVNGQGLAFAVGAFGTVLRSTDAGRSWSRQDIDWSTSNPEAMEPHLYGLHVGEDGSVLLVGEFGVILRSGDGGVNWSQVHGGEASLFALDLGDDGIGFAVGQQGTVLRTADGGRSWSAEPAVTAANLLGVRQDARGAVLVTGMRTLVTGNRGGGTWQVSTPGDVATTWYVGLAAGRDGWLAAGHNGRIVAVTP